MVTKGLMESQEDSKLESGIFRERGMKSNTKMRMWSWVRVFHTRKRNGVKWPPHSFEWSKIGNLVIACNLKKNWDTSVKKLSSVSGIRRRLGGVGNHSKQSSSPVFFHWEGGGNGARTAASLCPETLQH